MIDNFPTEAMITIHVINCTTIFRYYALTNIYAPNMGALNSGFVYPIWTAAQALLLTVTSFPPITGKQGADTGMPFCSQPPNVKLRKSHLLRWELAAAALYCQAASDTIVDA
jgi:hypothetical protein